MTLVLIDNFDSFTYNLVQQTEALAGEAIEVFRNDAITIDDLMALKPRGIILSPGPGHPKNPEDIGVGLAILNNAEMLGCPILGVCLGHQTIAHHFGASVTKAPTVMHGKTSTVKVIGQSVLTQNCPETFQVMRYHSLIVNRDSLPDCLTATMRLAESDAIMAIEHKTLPLFGVQFHPESIGTPEGHILVKNFITLANRFSLTTTASLNRS